MEMEFIKTHSHWRGWTTKCKYGWPYQPCVCIKTEDQLLSFSYHSPAPFPME